MPPSEASPSSEPPPVRRPSRARPEPRADALEQLRLVRLLTPEHIAQVLDSPRSKNPRDRWTAERAQRLLQRSGLGFQMAPRGRWYTTLQRMRDKLPAIADLYLARVHDDDLDHL